MCRNRSQPVERMGVSEVTDENPTSRSVFLSPLFSVCVHAYQLLFISPIAHSDPSIVASPA